jgi:putative ABC transport system permease protein
MELLNILRLALRAIQRNKVRSALTALGVIIGVASVIAMIALSTGASASIDAQIQSQGTNVIYLSAGSMGGRGTVRGGAGSTSTLTIDDAVAVTQQIATVARWTPVVRTRVQVIFGAQNWSTSVEGGGEDYLTVRNWPVASGEAFTGREIQSAEKVCLLGSTVAKTLFPDDDPVGQVIRVRNMPFRVMGVLASKGQNQFGQDQDDIVLMPYTTAQKKLLGITYINQVIISATSEDAVEPTAKEITRIMRARHRIPEGGDDDFMVRTIEELAATRVQMAQTMTGLLMSVASVSLLVGGIGIMNIMLVSVTERTREIGLRMAVGARTRDILRQFLVEAVALSVAGGAIGIVFGILISKLLTSFLQWPTAISPLSIGIAFLFAGAVGIFFGYYPARRAAGLDPIEALRYE